MSRPETMGPWAGDTVARRQFSFIRTIEVGVGVSKIRRMSDLRGEGVSLGFALSIWNSTGGSWTDTEEVAGSN